MRIGTMMATAAAAGLLSTGAMAQVTTGGGQTTSTAQGSTAVGGTMGKAQQMRKKHQQRREDRRDRRDRGDDAATANSASTYGSGTIYTDRRHATGGVTAGASAAGTGDQSTATSIDAYGSTTRQGSDAEVYGDAAASSTTPDDSSQQ
jgi:hypothetical protein